MICPNCGCEQRDTGRCIQCQMTLPGFKELSSKNEASPPPVLSSKRAGKEESGQEEEAPSITERTDKRSRKPSRKEPIRVVRPERRPQSEEGAQKVLITTTQKIEGKKIKNYFGLINANIIIDLEEPLDAATGGKVSSSSASHRSQLKTGVLLALRDLRGEAALYGANAVVGASFNFHRIDPGSLLLSALGTAVWIEEPG